jgi:hypothetical protein
MAGLANGMSCICKKYDIPLVKNNTTNTYRINFNLINPAIDLRTIINFNLYTFLAKINDDTIESVRLVSKLHERSATFLFLFKSIGKDFGIPKKYMYLQTDIIQENNNLKYKSKSIPIGDLNVKGYEPITCESSLLQITMDTDHVADVIYDFKLDLHEDLPIYMKNLPGLMMKKIFYHLKLFIENIK